MRISGNFAITGSWLVDLGAGRLDLIRIASSSFRL